MNATDPLLYEIPLPYRRTLYPFGYAATIVTNCEHIVGAAEDLWGAFESTHGEPAVELRFAVSESDSDEVPPACLPRGQGHLITTVHDTSNFVVGDMRSGFAFGWFTPRVALNKARFRYHFLEPYVYLLLESLYLTPVHAACVSLHERGVLLCGDSQAGKTTLSYACARRGWTYTSDDGSHLIRKSNDRVLVGNPYQIRFRPHAKELFPELSPFAVQDRPNGKPSLEVETRSLNSRVAVEAQVDYVVFLNRTSAATQQLVTYDRREALRRMSEVISIGEDSVRQEQRSSLLRLTSAPIYEMQYHDLDWAEQRLRSLIENGN